MAAVNLLGMEPEIVLSGQPEGKLIVLVIISSYIDGVTVGGFKTHRLCLFLLHALFACIAPDIAAFGQLLTDFLQLSIGIGSIQFFQNAFQVLQLLLAQFQLPGQLLLGIFHPGIVLVELAGVLLGG